MNKTKLKYVKYTKQELNRYVRDKSSCIILVNSEMHIGFPPWGFSTFQETLTNIISREKIGKFDPKMNGIVLDVRNVKVFGTNYAVHDDDPINHININANFYIFQPIIGSTIKGIVKHISHGHVAVIIYRVFNVSIRFNRMQRQQQFCVNDTISFRIKKFDLQGAMPYIEGELIPEIAQTKTKPQIHKIFDENDIDVGNGADSGISTEETSDKKVAKAVQKQTAQSSSSESESDSDSSSDSTDAKPLNKILLKNLKIKQEKFSDSDDEAIHSKRSKGKKGLSKERNASSSSYSESETSGSDESSINQAHLRNIKKEKATSESSSSSSGSNSDSSSENGQSLETTIKKEKEDIISLPHPLSREIKSEPISDIDRQSTKQIPKIDNETKLAKNKRKSTMPDETNSTDSTETSTLMPNAKDGKTKKIKKKLVYSITDETSVKVEKAVQNEDERPKKKRKTERSLQSMESALFESFTR